MNRLAEYFQQKYYPDLSIEEVASAMGNPMVKENAIKHLHQNNYPDMDVNELANVAFQPNNFPSRTNIPVPSPFPVKENFKQKPLDFNFIRPNSDNMSNYTDVPKNANNPAPDPLINIIYQTALDQGNFSRGYNVGSELGTKYNNKTLGVINTGLEFVKTKTPILGDALINAGQEVISAIDKSIENKDKYKSRLDSRIKQLPKLPSKKK